MSSFRFRRLHVANFRCFEALDLALEDDITVLFAENGGGKTALLSALAMGVSVIQPGSAKDSILAVRRDPRMVAINERDRKAAGSCTLAWNAEIGEAGTVEWSTTVDPASGRSKKEHGSILDAIERTRLPGERWPLFAWYGTNRFGRNQSRRKNPRTNDRWEGYAASLNPQLDEAPLLQWLTDEFLSDAVRRREGQEERFLDAVVTGAMSAATPSVTSIWYEPRDTAPSVRLENGTLAAWSELSDGLHVFLALVGDIARRAIMLNESDRGDAPALVEGVVLIDEIDLHLHPRWQRVALDGLRGVFPKLQFVVSTHSPQVLSSALNRQVRRLVNWTLQENDVFVEGRDSNAILRELMDTDDRGEEGVRDLRILHDAIDAGRREEAERLYAELLSRWGINDPALIRARGFMDWEE